MYTERSLPTPPGGWLCSGGLLDPAHRPALEGLLGEQKLLGAGLQRLPWQWDLSSHTLRVVTSSGPCPG